jgi:GT2 family glycosyltransferase
LLSVIVPARNDPVSTRHCLGAAIRSLDALNLRGEFLLIDDASEPADGIAQVFADTRANTPHHQFKIARCNERFHYTGVFSLGIHLAEMERVFFLSNDMVITPQFFSAVLGVAALSHNFGIVRGTSNYCDSHPEHTVQPPTFLRNNSGVARFSKSIFKKKGLAFSVDRVLSGDAVLVSRSLIDRIGVLDLRFFGYLGDIDYGLRAHLAGFKLVCAKGAWLWHKGAGHLKADAIRQKRDMPSLCAERMKLVENAYQAFRQKWDIDLPATYSQLGSLHLFPIAEKNASRVDLKCEFPAEMYSKYEILQF